MGFCHGVLTNSQTLNSRLSMYASRLKICLSLRLQYDFAGTRGIFFGPSPWHPRSFALLGGLAFPLVTGEPSTYLALRATGPLFVSRSLRGPGTVRPILPQALGRTVPLLLDHPLSAQQCAHCGAYPVMLLIWLTV